MEQITTILESTGKGERFKSGTRVVSAAEEVGLGIRSDCGKKGICEKRKIVL